MSDVYASHRQHLSFRGWLIRKLGGYTRHQMELHERTADAANRLASIRRALLIERHAYDPKAEHAAMATHICVGARHELIRALGGYTEGDLEWAKMVANKRAERKR